MSQSTQTTLITTQLGIGVVGESVRQDEGEINESRQITSATALNIFGYAVTRVANSDAVTVGGTAAFAGIISKPKAISGQGSSGDPLGVQNTVAQNTFAQLQKRQQAGFLVYLQNAAQQDWTVDFDQATGALYGRDPGTAIGAGRTNIPNSRVRDTSTGAGIAVITFGV